MNKINISTDGCSCFAWEVVKTQRKDIVFSADRLSHYAFGSSPSQLRKKFKDIFLVSSPLFLLARLPARCFFLLTGSWGIAGAEKAKKIWAQKCVTHFNSEIAPPKPLIYYRIFIVSVGSELIKDICKCTTLPLALVGILFGSLWGMVSPYDGRKIIGDIENLWSIELPDFFMDRRIVFITNYMALCMKDIESFKDQNLFRILQNYNPQTLRSLLLALEGLNKNGLSHVEKMKDHLEIWERKAKGLVKKESEEVMDTGEILFDSTKPPIRKALLALHSLQINITALIVNRASQATINAEKNKLSQAIQNVDQAFP